MTALGTRSDRRPVSEESPHLRLLTAAFGIVLLGGALFRFWSLSSRPGWQYDEGVYTGVAANLLQHGTVNEHITYGAPWAPDLYQPPFYFIVLARWFALTGVSIYHARIFGVLCALAGLTLLWRLLVRVHGPQVGLYAMVPIVFDGWLMYVQRISYMENMLLLLVVAGMLLYQRALDTPSWWRFAAAGVVLGFAAAFKYTGVYVIGAVLLCWLITKRAHREAPGAARLRAGRVQRGDPVRGHRVRHRRPQLVVAGHDGAGPPGARHPAAAAARSPRRRPRCTCCSPSTTCSRRPS